MSAALGADAGPEGTAGAVSPGQHHQPVVLAGHAGRQPPAVHSKRVRRVHAGCGYRGVYRGTGSHAGREAAAVNAERVRRVHARCGYGGVRKETEREVRLAHIG